MEGPVARRLRDFRGLPRDSLTGRTSNREKHLYKFFKIFALSVLVIGFGDLLATGPSTREQVTRLDSEIFAAYLATLSRVELLIAKNIYINFSKFLP